MKIVGTSQNFLFVIKRGDRCCWCVTVYQGILAVKY